MGCIYIYIYIYIYKPGKWFEDENIQRITVKGENILEKKEKANLVIPIEKKSKETHMVGQKKKTPFGLLSYNAKSAQY